MNNISSYNSNSKIVKGSELNIIQLNVRGQLIPIYSNSMIFQTSERLKNDVKEKKYPIYIDVDPSSFHSILTYFKHLSMTAVHSDQVNEDIQNLFIDSFINNPNILACFVYLEMPVSFINQFIRKD